MVPRFGWMKWTVLTAVLAGTLYAADVPKEWLNFGGRPNDVNWTAKWIWIDGPASPRNFYMCARRDFQLADIIPADTSAEALRLHIAADSRYRLYINGEWIGDGPARSFYWAQQYDTYDVTGLLKSGRNCIAVLVSHYGEGTFQYNPSGQGGLLVQVERKDGDAWKPILVTDESWQVRQHEGYLRPTVRISCQMPFEEIVDGRLMPGDWMMPSGTLVDSNPPARGRMSEPVVPGALNRALVDSNPPARGRAGSPGKPEHAGSPIQPARAGAAVQPAKVIGPVGSGPWKTMVARTVPFMTREPITPVRLWKTQLVRMPSLHTGFTTRPYLLPGYYMQNARELNGFAATIIDSPVDQTISFPHLVDRFEDPIINGQRAGDHQAVPLHKGQNLCVIALRPGGHHEYDRSYCAFVEQPVKLAGVFNTETAWTIFGPFEKYQTVFDRVSKAATLADLEPFKPSAQVVKPKDILTHGSPWDESTAARPVPGEVRIDHPDGLLGSNATVTTVYPSKDGAPELWLDFGRELVGNTQFDVDAPAGTTLTFNCFEEIEDGKRVHYTNGNYAGFRYISGGGRQQFTSFLRRGYRYMKLIVSDASGPVDIRSIRTIFSTHPAIETGAFACSDPLLTRIWQVGRHTLRCCSEDTYTDCPAYEQTYWVGDGRNEAMVDYAAYGNLALSRRCAELPAVSLGRQLITESQVPSAWDNLLTAWSLLWVQMTEEHYQFSGDKQYLAGIYPAVSRMLHNIREKLTDERGLLSINAWNLFDWAGQDNGHALVTHNQMFLVEAIRRAEMMARELGKDDDAKYWADYRQALIAAINKHLWSDSKGAYVDAIHGDGKQSDVVSQQTNSLALLYGVAPPDRAAKIKHAPDAPPAGMVKVGSPFALFYMLDALVHDGRHAEAMAIIRSRWGEMVKHGATTFWETFPGFDAKWWTRSYCHAWSAAPTYFLSRYQLGAWWEQPGYKVARIAPVPLDLTWARGAVPTPHGPIQVAWEKAADKFTLEVNLPKAVAAIVELPVPAEEFAKVTPAELKPRQVNGKWQIDLPAGADVTIEAAKK